MTYPTRQLSVPSSVTPPSPPSTAYLACLPGGNGAGLPVDISGAGAHATRGASLSPSALWSTAGAMSSAHTADSGGVILLPPSVAAVDFSAGESLLVMFEVFPESGINTNLFGNWPAAGFPGFRATITGGTAFRPSISDGAHNVSVPSNKVPLTANSWNKFAVGFDGVTKYISTWSGGVLKNITDASTVTGSTVNTTHYMTLGHGGKRISGTTNDPAASWLVAWRNLHFLKFPSGFGLPGVVQDIVEEWSANPGALLTLESVGI